MSPKGQGSLCPSATCSPLRHGLRYNNTRSTSSAACPTSCACCTRSPGCSRSGPRFHFLPSPKCELRPISALPKQITVRKNLRPRLPSLGNARDLANGIACRTPLEDFVPFTATFWQLPCLSEGVYCSSNSHLLETCFF